MALNFFVANSEEIIFPGILVELYQFPESRYGLAVSASTAGTLAGQPVPDPGRPTSAPWNTCAPCFWSTAP